MARPDQTPTMALFCDFENVALGVRDAHLPRFEIQMVLERMLSRGSIIVKKAYCNWNRYAEDRREMHRANFELIEVPGLSQSGKNSADIRMVVDALDLCYTKEHVSTFVLVTGDSDFSPLVSKLRENNKTVIGVGVRNSTSELLVSNCDEFIFYDDLLERNRHPEHAAAEPTAAEDLAVRGTKTTRKPSSRKKAEPKAQATPRAAPAAKATASKRTAESEQPDLQAEEASPEPTGVPTVTLEQSFDLMLETLESIFADRDESDLVWGSMLKQSMRRRRPDFSEKVYGFRTFGAMLEEAQHRGLVVVQKDDKRGDYRLLGFGANG